MKILKINSINGYKSFTDFSWSKYCKKQDKQGACLEPLMSDFTVFFGENGSGKSSLCDILKNLSENRDFAVAKPTSSDVVIEDNSVQTTYTYSSASWDATIPSSSILFFDVDFINANVHTNGMRSSNLLSGAHTQKSGKLIIELDQKANELNDLVHQAKDSVELFEKTNKSLVDLIIGEEDKTIFEEFKALSKVEIAGKIAELEGLHQKQLKTFATLSKLFANSKDIQKIQIPLEIKFDFQISKLESYQEVSKRVVENKVKIEVDQKIKTHFDLHKNFIEYAKNHIPEDYKDSDCPLCMQPLNKAIDVIEFYRSIFDKTFETNKAKFLNDIATLTSEVLNIESFISSLDKNIAKIFDYYEQIKNNFDLVDLYKVDEKTDLLNQVGKLSLSFFQDMKSGLEGLKRIDKIDFEPTETYKKLQATIIDVSGVITNLNTMIRSKNQLISNLKTKYTDTTKIEIDLDATDKILKEIKAKIEFLKQDKITLISKYQEMSKEREKLLEAKKSSEKNRDDYITQRVPENIINKMVEILHKFNLNFTIEPHKSSSLTKEYAFSFKIKDNQGYERELKDGLSEGERQLISLALFFSINENVSDRKSKIVIFDDPITSLDAPNLKILSEIIHNQISKYSQVVVFTHHPLFHKYLTKPDINGKSKFGILKNSDLFGGSFIFSDPGYDMIEEIKLCNQEISNKATSGALKMEEISLKYGQLLRLAVERFIKNDLLMWNNEKDFKQIVGNLASSKSKISKLTNDDLDIMLNIYNYCNYSNLLHADKENPSALSELTNNIDRFCKIIDKSQV